MESVLRVQLPKSKRLKLSSIDYTSCILCQEKTTEYLVQKPKSFTKLLNALKIRRDCGDEQFLEASLVLQNSSDEDLRHVNCRWHQSCYKNCTHKGHVDRLLSHCNAQQEVIEGISDVVSNDDSKDIPFTRSRIVQLSKDACFFCDKRKSIRWPLYTVSTKLAGEKICKAVNISDIPAWKVKLSGCIDPTDAHAYDISYHSHCYTTNVLNVLRVADSNAPHHSCVAHTASKEEFINCLSDALKEGNIITMEDAEKKYNEVCSSNNVDGGHVMSRKKLKTFIEDELCELDIDFINPLRKNQSQRISLKVSQDVIASQAEAACSNQAQMKCLFEAAKTIRNIILNSKKWNFTGSVAMDKQKDVVPEELEFFYRWCIAGNDKFEVCDVVGENVRRSALTLSQGLMYECITAKQINVGHVRSVQHTYSYPLQVGMGLTIHAKTRSKFLVNLMHSFGVSIDYSKVLRIETSIANAVIQQMENNGGEYIPQDLVSGRFTFFACDNLDFLEDTPDGKGTLHATVMTCYQESLHSDTSTCLLTYGSGNDRSLKELPKCMTHIVEYHGTKTLKTSNALFKIDILLQHPSSECARYINLDLAWFLCRSITMCAGVLPHEIDNVRTSSDETSAMQSSQRKATSKEFLPTWAAFNSVLQDRSQSLTRVCLLPILPVSPTDRSVQMTFLTRLERVAKHVCGVTAKCVVTLDMGLYRPVQQLIMSRSDMHDRWILRPGELHIAFAALRAIGLFIDGTGIGDVWSILYSDTTICNIIAGKNFRRSVEAHTRMMLALSNCYFTAFFDKHENLRTILSQAVVQVKAKFHSSGSREAVEEFLVTMTSINLSEKLQAFDEAATQTQPTFKLLRQYMSMFQLFLLFIRSVRSGNWALHIASLERLVKYFFAFDLTNYSGMISLYLAEMKTLQESHPEVWNEFERGNWVVKRSHVPFCALGSDEALEQQNRALKVLGGLVGITQHPHTLARFFLTAPQLLTISEETQNMSGCTARANIYKHHLDSAKATQSQEVAAVKLQQEINRLGNPFTIDGPQLINFATKAVFSSEIEADVNRVHDLGTDLHNTFTRDRLVNGSMSVWAPIRRNNLKLCSSTKKKVKVKLANSVAELKADRSLFARLLIITRSTRGVDLCQTIGEYEMSAIPRSMFNSDGGMHQCPAKSKLIHALQSHAASSDESPATVPTQSSFVVAIVDAMAELQALDKSRNILTCSDLFHNFASKIDMKYRQYYEIHLVFDTYFEQSIKNITRHKRRHGESATQYKICDTTNISSITMTKLLSHTVTKDELTDYLACKLLKDARFTDKKLVVAWRSQAAATHCDFEFLGSSHEEADTKIILHAINAKQRGAETLLIFAQDTDVLILALTRYERLPKQSYFVPRVGEYISLRNICMSLGANRIAALPGFHALSGCDTTGSLLHKGKLSYWKAFIAATEGEVLAMRSLGSSETVTNEVALELEAFICRVYQPNANIKTLANLRWLMFTKKQTLTDSLPPTRSSLAPAIQRANFQAFIWRQDDLTKPTVLSPIGHGWFLEGGQLTPLMCDKPCAPDAVLELIKCACEKSRCSSHCKCVGNGLPCTEMCNCSGDATLCDNADKTDGVVAHTSDEDSSEASDISDSND